MEKLKVYVIDDNEDHCKIMSEYYSRHPQMGWAGYSLDPQEGFEALKELCPDVVLLDNVMPKLDGLGVLEMIQNTEFSRGRPKVIMVTASITDQFQAEATRLGAAYCTSRYIDLEELDKRIVLVCRPPVKLVPYLSMTDSNGDSIELIIARMMHEVGVPAHIKGYCYLREAIAMVAEDMSRINYITKLLYPEVARRHDTTSSRVERAIRHAIEVAWNRADTDVLNNMFGYTIDRNRGKPTNGEFIAMLSNMVHLKMKA